MGVANVTIYLDDELAERVRANGLPISRTCQHALRTALAELDDGGPPPTAAGQLDIYDRHGSL